MGSLQFSGAMLVSGQVVIYCHLRLDLSVEGVGVSDFQAEFHLEAFFPIVVTWVLWCACKNIDFMVQARFLDKNSSKDSGEIDENTYCRWLEIFFCNP